MVPWPCNLKLQPLYEAQVLRGTGYANNRARQRGEHEGSHFSISTRADSLFLLLSYGIKGEQGEPLD
jgi:hypothetical protein